MPKGFRPSLEPPSHRKMEREVRRPCFCMASATTVGLLVFLVFAVVGWNIYDHRFSKTLNKFHSGDEISLKEVTSDLSETFCDRYKVTTWQKARAFLLHGRAKVNTSNVTHVPIFVPEMPTKRSEVLAFYLLEGSSLHLSACRQNGSKAGPSDIVLLKGESCFRDFRRHLILKEDCLVAMATIPVNASCDSGQSVSLRGNITYRSTYYTVINYGRPDVLPSRHPPGIVVNGTLTRTHFDLSNAKMPPCLLHDDKSCDFRLHWASSRDVVVRFSQDFHQGDQTTTLITECHVRVVLWTFAFGVPPFVISGLAAVIFAWCFCRKRKPDFAKENRESHRRQKRERKARDKRNLVENEVVPQNEDHSITIQDD